MASGIIHHDRWISLRADDCVSDEGVAFAPWYVLENPDWVQVVAVTDAQAVVLIEQYRHGRAIISLELPNLRRSSSVLPASICWALAYLPHTSAGSLKRCVLRLQ